MNIGNITAVETQARLLARQAEDAKNLDAIKKHVFNAYELIIGLCEAIKAERK